MSPRILVIDIETSPNVADVWGLFKQNVSLNQLRESTEVISFSAKWVGEELPVFYSVYDFSRKKITDRQREKMVKEVWKLLDEADVVIHYNGTSFDIPHLFREFLKRGMTPPSPFQQIDLLLQAKSSFRFTSNKLDYVSQYLGFEGKVSHEGHGLWVKCMAGDYDAWLRMMEYNNFDVVLTEGVYEKLLPWIKSHPHMGLFNGEEQACQRCGGTNLTRQGYSYTKLARYQQYKCKECSSWSRGKKALESVDARGVQ